MRRLIRNAAPLSIWPDQVRGMIPRDWCLVVDGLEESRAAGQPGADAPSADEVADLVAMYG